MCARAYTTVRRRSLTLIALGLCSLMAEAQQNRIITAGAFVDPQGQLQSNVAIGVESGVIKQIAGTPEEIAQMLGAFRDAGGAARIDEYADGVICPGLIDIGSALGAVGHLSEPQAAVQPDANAADSFNRYQARWRAALRSGVTTLALTPGDDNLVGGQIAVCKSGGADDRPYVLTRDGPLKLSLAPAVFSADREPTSRSGALAMLRASLASASQQRDSSALAAFAAGRISGIVAAPNGADVLTLLQLAQEFSLKFVLVHERDARDVASIIARAKTGVVVGPYGLKTSPRAARAAGIFEKAGVPVSIAGGLPHRDAAGLRRGAALATRYGMSPDAARRAITIVPAEQLGVGDRLGSIESGKQADFAVFSGDPLDLRSRVLAVYIDGRRVYAAADETE